MFGSPKPYWDDGPVARICIPCSQGLRAQAEARYGRQVDIATNRGSTTALELVVELANLLGRVPPGSWRREIEDLPNEMYLMLWGLSTVMPSEAWYVYHHRSWFEALIAAGVLPSGTEKMVLGYRTIANDGHVCRSLGEKSIDDWFHANGVAHDREPHYPDSNYRADFAVNGRYVEYFGLAGDAEYDVKSERKREMARTCGIELVEVFPADLVVWKSIQYRFAAMLGFEVRA